MGSRSGFNKIILSRTDNIGDVMLTLPLAGYLKSCLPGVVIYFIGKAYTAPIIESCSHIDFFLERGSVIADPDILRKTGAELIIHIYPDKKIAAAAFAAKVPLRVGTSHRLFHWFYCNKLVPLSRKNSGMHEVLLNFKLIQAVFPQYTMALDQVPSYYGLQAVETLPEFLQKYTGDGKIKIILHPKSKGSAREWPLENYKALALKFSPAVYDIFVTGSAEEGNAIRQKDPEIFSSAHIHDLTGKLNLGQLITFISQCQGLVACSTGPLHIASALGIVAIGLYPPMKPIDPGRWAAIGRKTKILVLDTSCNDCRVSQNCHCIQSILVENVEAEIRKIHG